MHACFCCVWLGPYFSFSVLSQEIDWEERLRNDLFCVGWDVKPKLNQSIVISYEWDYSPHTLSFAKYRLTNSVRPSVVHSRWFVSTWFGQRNWHPVLQDVCMLVWFNCNSVPIILKVYSSTRHVRDNSWAFLSHNLTALMHG